ncbi:flagellar hook-length control protein FliK [Variovorax ureilyticus]|uniref:flagellar hook-length control protein FliK n=1 Tax=Variovorax ureilyticus TaxID=1836198 RepID=UPI003D6671F7
MPTVISPSINLLGPQGAASGPRGRNAEQPEGRSFGAALDRSRATSAADTQESAETSGTAPLAGRKTARAEDKKSELSADDVMALLTPLQAPVVPAAAPGRLAPEQATKGGAGATVDGLAAGSASGTLPEEAPVLPDGAAQTAADQAAAKTARAAAAPAHDDHAEAPAANPPDDAALPLATAAAAAATPPTDASPKAAVTTPSPTAGATTNAKAPAVKAAAAASDAPAAAEAATATAASADKPAVVTQAAAAVETAKADAPAARPDTASIEPAATPDAQALSALQAGAAPIAGRDAAPAQSAPVLTVAPQVGSTEWGPAIGHQMIRMSTTGHQVAELNLNPANLGPLKVTLTMGDNQAQAMFVSAHESVRKAVEAALPQLRTTLAEQGINLGQTSVGADTRQPNGGNAFAQQNPSRPQGQPDYPGSGRADSAAAQTVAAAPSAASALRRATAGLDTFA